LIWLDLTNLYNLLNFGGLAWMSDPVYGPPNRTGLATKIADFLCPSDCDWGADPFDLGHTNYRGNAGTLPCNLAAGSPVGTDRNDGAFWFQGAVGPRWSAIAATDDECGPGALGLPRLECLESRS
jgi:hypothetical protein